MFVDVGYPDNGGMRDYSIGYAYIPIKYLRKSQWGEDEFYLSKEGCKHYSKIGILGVKEDVGYLSFKKVDKAKLEKKRDRLKQQYTYLDKLLKTH